MEYTENQLQHKESENLSAYSEIVRQGGHKGLLSMECAPEPEVVRPQKGCGNLSYYSKMAKGGGHKGLLSMEHDEEASPIASDECNRKQKPSGDVSDYTVIALQGGHKDLLTIDDPTASDADEEKTTKSNSSRRTYGDWYQGNPKNQEALVANEQEYTPVRDLRKGNGNCIVPGDDEVMTPSKCGKKMFGRSNIRQEAPFATNY